MVSLREACMLGSCNGRAVALAWDQRLSRDGGIFTFSISTNQEGSWPDRPIMELFNVRIRPIGIMEGTEFNPVITDNFIMLPLKGSFKKGLRNKKNCEDKTQTIFSLAVSKTFHVFESPPQQSAGKEYCRG